MDMAVRKVAERIKENLENGPSIEDLGRELERVINKCVTNLETNDKTTESIKNALFLLKIESMPDSENIISCIKEIIRDRLENLPRQTNTRNFP